MVIAGAGMAAALPGVVAAHTTLPVIGVPIRGGAMDGLDALLSIAQMPPGVPVACVGLDNATNAAVLAVQIIAVQTRPCGCALHSSRRTSKRQRSKASGGGASSRAATAGVGELAADGRRP